MSGHAGDRLFITGLTLHAFHGCHAFEAKLGQRFVLDLVLELDLSAAATGDRLEDTASYDTIVEVARDAFCSRRFKLVEAAAAAVADALLAAFAKLEGVRVTVHKPNAPLEAVFADVSVTLVRRRPRS
jgi:dihydroneopterin aldolase